MLQITPIRNHAKKRLYSKSLKPKQVRFWFHPDFTPTEARDAFITHGASLGIFSSVKQAYWHRMTLTIHASIDE